MVLVWHWRAADSALCFGFGFGFLGCLEGAVCAGV